MKFTTKLFLTFIFIIAILPFAAAEGCSYNPQGGVVGCRSVITWGSYDNYIKSQTLSYAKSDPGERFMAWCPSQDAVPYVRSDSKLSTCGCPSEDSFNSYLKPGDCDTKKCSNCGNYVSYCKPKAPTPTCTNECVSGETKCSGTKIYECGNFDSDSCLEWGFKNDCFYHVEGQPYFKCEEDKSVQYKEIKEGFCKDIIGNHDYCDSKISTIKVASEYCASTGCSEIKFCQENDVYSKTQCINKGCDISNGKCYSNPTSSTRKVEDCGESTSSEFCQNDKIVFGKATRICKEEGDNAFCKAESDTTIVKDCGQDNCISHTNLNPFVFEYVEDNSGCIQNSNAHCGFDQPIYDMCLSTDILLQPFCNGKDHDIKEFECSSLDGCYDFTYTGCVNCNDAEGNCVAKNCTMKGKEFREYTCGSGKCQYSVSVHDIDKDRIDDRCDLCLDIDKDGICDEKDNCIGVSNKNQIDTDKDGMGDACDIDRDGDGYAAGYDCNDWNPKIHPFALEIEGNSIDEDCDPDTKDAVADTPQQAFFVDIAMDDAVKQGEEFKFMVTATNRAEVSMQDVQISAAMPGFQISNTKLVGKVKKGTSVTRLFAFKIPEDAEGYEYLRITVYNGLYKRVIYREVKIVTNK